MVEVYLPTNQCFQYKSIILIICLAKIIMKVEEAIDWVLKFYRVVAVTFNSMCSAVITADSWIEHFLLCENNWKI